MFPFDLAALPQLTTRKALLVVDPQRDFLSVDDGALPVTEPEGFAARTAQLAEAVRRAGGDVVWLPSRFEQRRDPDAEPLVASDAALAARPSHRHHPHQQHQQRHGGGGGARARRRRLSHPDDHDGDDGHHHQDGNDAAAAADDEAFLSHDPPRCVRPSTPGVELLMLATTTTTTTTTTTAIHDEDSTLWKSHYSAFLGTSLLRLLRAKMVMEVFICGSLANVGVYATALDAAGHGLAITVVDDCCGFRVAARKRKALRNLEELTGCEVARCADVVKALRSSSPAPAAAAAAAAATTPTEQQQRARAKAKAQIKSKAATTTASAPATSSTAPPPPEAAAKAKTPDSGRPAEPDLVRQIAGLRLAEESSPDVGVVVAAAIVAAVGEAHRQDDAAQPTAEAESQTSQNAQSKLQEPAGNGKDGAHQTAKSSKGEDGSKDGRSNAAATPKPHHQPAAEAARTASPEDKTPPLAQRPSTPPLTRPDESPHGVAMPGPEHKADAASATDHHSDDEQPAAHAPQKGLGAGDTDVIENLLPPDLEATMFDRLRDEVQWQRMSHQGGEVPRLVAVQGDVSDDDADGSSMPVYRHPSDESPPLLPFSPAVLDVKAQAERHLGHPLNHVLIQYYRDGNDYISEHSDKTLDIVRGSYIANVSLGAERTMVLRTKRPHKDPSRQVSAPLPPPPSSSSSTAAQAPPNPSPPAEPEDASQPAGEPKQQQQQQQQRQAQRLRLHHNSMCRMGLATNEQWLHAIRQDRRAARDKTPAELAHAGARISLTFRRIGTFLSLCDDENPLIWGQGATGKTRADARPVVNGQGPEAVAMLRAFGTENHASRFDWHAHYGAGFDVLHISNAPRFFASAADAVVNMRVALMLAEYGVKYARGSVAPALAGGGGSGAKGGEGAHDDDDDGEDGGAGWATASVPVKFVDNDASKSVVQGDVAIMLYLEAVYGERHRASAVSKSAAAAAGSPAASTPPSQLATQYTLFQRALQLLTTVRRHSNTRDNNNNKSSSSSSSSSASGGNKTDSLPSTSLPRFVKHELSTVWESAARDGHLCCAPAPATTTTPDAAAADDDDNRKMPSLADFALWPVLHALADAHDGGGGAFAGMDHLRRYYEAFAQRQSVRAVLSSPGTDAGANKKTASS
ncbi:hypothetical protein JDV02_002140 [Purpureocillium takamizusanense]|uniref:Fe2OG dioxygenase domain-containing protein n=1 Tax=Purpureocillium takamizusanense TaxID=2060973 RepID=A0A9Q8Q855_9HYPO|nr:uncharacterized protein JDV02_002140 [Purpureocillium takamizusanense]UNI15624.1 hypothetical protein JDV02_002140 [Purpureocillium takamizusanense]